VKALIAVIAGAVLLSATPAFGATPKKTLNVGDNYFAPQAVKVKSGTKVTWRWPGYDEAGDVHDVGLMKGPKGVKRFRSEGASTDYSFSRRLTVPGTYQFNCSLHHEMRMTLTVRGRS
jgi:plastocyanin